MPTPTRVVGRRVAAFLLDSVVLWSVTLGLFFLVAQRGSTETTLDSSSTLNVDVGSDRWYLEGAGATLFALLMLAGWTVYLGVLPGLTGWTPGKRLTGIRVVGPDGRPPGAWRGTVRSLLWIVDAFPYVLPGLVGFVVAQSTQRHQRVGDQVAGTFVVREGTVPETEERPPAPSSPPASAPAGWYADPHGQQRLRYWDGHDWTADTAP